MIKKRVAILIIYILMLQIGIAYSQEYKDSEIKAGFIYQFAQNIQWSDPNNSDSFIIGIYKNDTSLHAALKVLSNLKKIDNKPIVIKNYQNIDAIAEDSPQFLYLPNEFNSQIKLLFYQLSGSNTLLITDDCKNPIYVMLNFIYQDQNKISFEVNKKNIEDNRMSIQPKLLVMGGTELDVRKLYKLKEQELTNEQQKVKLQADKISEQEIHINQQQKRLLKQKEDILDHENQLITQNLKIEKQEENLSKLIEEIDIQNKKLLEKEALLKKHSSEYKAQNKLFIKQNQELLNGNSILEQQQLEIQKGLDQINSQKNNLKLLEGKVEVQKMFLYSSMLILVLILFIAILAYRNYKIKNRIYEALQDKNRALASSEEELLQLNDQLHLSNENLLSQKEMLEVTLKKLKETQTHLIQAEKMASVGILTSGIAHEINNPLNFIQGGKTAIELYMEDHLKEHLNELKPFMEMIEEGVLRASTIVRSLNHFNRRNELFTDVCDLHKIIDHCVVMLNHQFTHKVIIHKNYSKQKYVLKGNDGKLHQLFLNILTNAEQAIEETGSISITSKINNNNIEISITDTGCGISKLNLEKISDPFFTTKDPGKGTGLGLSIAHSIINEHNGSMEYFSELGEGTTVTITFPLDTNI